MDHFEYIEAFGLSPLFSRFRSRFMSSCLCIHTSQTINFQFEITAKCNLLMKGFYKYWFFMFDMNHVTVPINDESEAHFYSYFDLVGEFFFRLYFLSGHFLYLHLYARCGSLYRSHDVNGVVTKPNFIILYTIKMVLLL